MYSLPVPGHRGGEAEGDEGQGHQHSDDIHGCWRPGGPAPTGLFDHWQPIPSLSGGHLKGQGEVTKNDTHPDLKKWATFFLGFADIWQQNTQKKIKRKFTIFTESLTL